MNDSLTDQNNLTAALTAQMIGAANAAAAAAPMQNLGNPVPPPPPKSSGVSAETIARGLANKAKAQANPSPAVSVITIGSNDDEEGPVRHNNIR